MPVAKSYKDLKICGDPFIENKKQYIMVQDNYGHQKKVRWYTDKEYARMYPPEYTPPLPPSHITWGFIDGFIWLPREKYHDWFQQEARISAWWGNYFASDVTPPVEIPCVKLYWADVSDENGKLLNSISKLAAAADRARKVG